MKLRSFDLIFTGLGSILFLLGHMLFSSNSHQYDLFSTLTYFISAILAITVYQPHFIFSYYKNYYKKKSYCKRPMFTLIFVPILLFIFILSSLLYLGFINHKAVGFIQFFLVIVLLMVSWHFASQSLYLVKFYSKLKINKRNYILLKCLFFFTFVFGTFSCYLQLHEYPFYGLPTRDLIHLKIDFSSLKSARLFILALHLCCILGFAKHFQIRSLLTWSAFLCWTLTETFTKKFFYVVPIFHSLELIPLFLNYKIQKMGVRLYSMLLAISIIVFCIFFQAIYFLEKTGVEGSYSYSKFFVIILLSLNFHHVFLERFTWKK